MLGALNKVSRLNRSPNSASIRASSRAAAARMAAQFEEVGRLVDGLEPENRGPDIRQAALDLVQRLRRFLALALFSPRCRQERRSILPFGVRGSASSITIAEGRM